MRRRDGRQGLLLGGSCLSPGTNWAAGDAPEKLPLESSLPGIFAVGDVRSGSVKRVGGAIGEGGKRRLI